LVLILAYRFYDVMVNGKFLCQLKIVFLGLLLCCGAQAQSSKVCHLNYDAFAPLSQDDSKVFAKISAKSIKSVDVFSLTESLAKYMRANGVNMATSKPVLKVQSALPRTNLLLAYDIFLLSQLYNQQQLGLVSVPPQLQYPSEILPSHVYQWVDASVALWRCHWNKTDAESLKPSTTRMEITPSEVYYLMTDIQSNLMQAIAPKFLREFLVLRMQSVNFLLQDIFLESGFRLSQQKLASVEQQHPTLDILLLNSLVIMSELNGHTYLTNKQSVRWDKSNIKIQFQLITSSILVGELLYFNAQKQSLTPVPMLPILNRPLSDESLLSQLIEIYQMLITLKTHADVQHASKN
jgi:hypothetical protein